MAKMSLPRSFGGLRVLIAGGGVAGLEALLALRELAEEALWWPPSKILGRHRAPFLARHPGSAAGGTTQRWRVFEEKADS